MRITQELLIKFAQDYVTKQTRKPNDIVAVFLTGSVLTPEPLIGGTTDIDLVMVHKEDPAVEREVQRVSYEISLDIQHHHQSFYTFHRRLRLNPWLGYALCSHNGFLYDTDHWLEFIQAGVSAQFDTPETVYARAQAITERARQLWFELEDPQELPLKSGWINTSRRSIQQQTGWRYFRGRRCLHAAFCSPSPSVLKPPDEWSSTRRSCSSSARCR